MNPQLSRWAGSATCAVYSGIPSSADQRRPGWYLRSTLYSGRYSAAFVPSLILNNDEVDPFYVGGPQASTTAVREISSASGNPPQRTQDLRVTSIRTSPLNQVAGATVSLAPDGRILVNAPSNYFSMANGVRVAAPILLEYTLRDGGSSFYQPNPTIPTYLLQFDPKESVGTITVDVSQVNDAPIPTSHSVNNAIEDTVRSFVPSELLLTSAT